MTENGFYIIDNKFFSDYPDPYLKGNKEENRPHYYALFDAETGLYWMIPLSSKTEKYKRIMRQRSERHQSNDILHICDVGTGQESVFVIGDMFPITEEYILRAYTISGRSLVLKKEHDIQVLRRKALRVLNLIHRGVKFTPLQADVLVIEQSLKQRAEDQQETP